ncbi:helicase associated domain-containing protein [Streptomyces sp. MUSC 14]|uniref:helicase associated domain-containing protein n=1 Tax=Streptomyces sp. MUSC 14 TaxID=1354889 RepID=UPI0009A0BA63
MTSTNQHQPFRSQTPSPTPHRRYQQTQNNHRPDAPSTAPPTSPRRRDRYQKIHNTPAQATLTTPTTNPTITTEEEKPPPRRKHSDRWALNYTAARQYYEREGHLRVPRGHLERILTGDNGDQEERDLKLGSWIGNQRSRAASLSPERVEQLTAIVMRWA